ncbi:MAG TPA: hypothetical protein VGC29_11155 [Flavisolibacter sp.]
MAINKNHEFEELNGIKCAIVERNVSQQRVEFLRSLLELNGYQVVVADMPPPKAAPAPAAAVPAEGAPVAEATPPPPPPPPTSFVVGVTDVSFNPVNAIFGRLLKTKDGNTVTLAYWNQKEKVSHDEIPYFDRGLQVKD